MGVKAKRAPAPLVRGFPDPWQVIERDDAFQIVDVNGFPLALVPFIAEGQPGAGTGGMTRDEARRMALRIAALPDFQHALRGQYD